MAQARREPLMNLSDRHRSAGVMPRMMACKPVQLLLVEVGQLGPSSGRPPGSMPSKVGDRAHLADRGDLLEEKSSRVSSPVPSLAAVAWAFSWSKVAGSACSIKGGAGRP